ncbi:PP2C family protein-serine/threonine phosphatase [Microscilla marina]|uniref:Serine/threonine protein kinases n=1 Tax=Microscilla marina ATCC 23134 TaxID=313606 RepID=A1ZR27_MICM2|nr:SpoIIE family protein phosphatase [Microscilla marina]EAY27116.1 serine/threonine protein kinases [Microscilla marina ATCC 23134]
MEIYKLLGWLNERSLLTLAWSATSWFTNPKVLYLLWALLGGGITFIVGRFLRRHRFKDQLDLQQAYLQQLKHEMAPLQEALYQSQDEVIVQRGFINDQNNALRLYQHQQDQSLRLAQGIQQAILPSNKHLEAVFPQSFVFFRPKKHISGDFYWCCRIEQQSFVAVVDCAGHDIPGAFMSLMGYTLLNHFVKVKGLHNPAQVLTQLHKKMQQLLGQQEAREYNEIDIAFCQVEETIQQTNRVTFAGAWSSLFYVTAQLPCTIQECQGAPKSIGNPGSENLSIANQQVLLPQGSSFYLCSDGYMKQPNAQNKKMGKLRLMDTLQTLHLYDLLSQKLLLEQKLCEYQRAAPQYDDVLVLGVRL